MFAEKRQYLNKKFNQLHMLIVEVYIRQIKKELISVSKHTQLEKKKLQMLAICCHNYIL